MIASQTKTRPNFSGAATPWPIPRRQYLRSCCNKDLVPWSSWYAKNYTTHLMAWELMHIATVFHVAINLCVNHKSLLCGCPGSQNNLIAHLFVPSSWLTVPFWFSWLQQALSRIHGNLQRWILYFMQTYNIGWCRRCSWRDTIDEQKKNTWRLLASGTTNASQEGPNGISKQKS